MFEFRLRVCYRKGGRLRFLSHLEVARACERAVRRASLPYAVTQGFSPKMKVAFGPALPVATEGEREYFDLWLISFVGGETALGRLAGSTPKELAPREVRYVSPGEGSLSAGLTIARYRILMGGPVAEPKVWTEALETVRSRGQLSVEHKGRQKVFDLADALPEEPEASVTDAGVAIEVTIRIGPSGSLRPEALIRAAAQLTGAPGVIEKVTRTELLAEDEDGWHRP